MTARCCWPDDRRPPRRKQQQPHQRKTRRTRGDGEGERECEVSGKEDDARVFLAGPVISGLLWRDNGSYIPEGRPRSHGNAAAGAQRLLLDGGEDGDGEAATGAPPPRDTRTSTRRSRINDSGTDSPLARLQRRAVEDLQLATSNVCSIHTCALKLDSHPGALAPLKNNNTYPNAV